MLTHVQGLIAFVCALMLHTTEELSSTLLLVVSVRRTLAMLTNTKWGVVHISCTLVTACRVALAAAKVMGIAKF